MARIPMNLSEFEGHFCCYEWQNASCGPSASGELLVGNCYAFEWTLQQSADWHLDCVSSCCMPSVLMPSVLWHCWLGGRNGIRPVKKLSGGMLAWLS